jgi:hypothetical protein
VILVEGSASLVGDRWCLGLSDWEHGRLAVPAMPATASLLPVAGQLLTEMGKATPEEGFHASDVAAAQLWLRAHRVGDVVLTHPDLYRAPLLEALDDLVASGGGRLWAVADPEHLEALRCQARGSVAQIVSWAAFQAHWRLRPPVELGVARDHARTGVPILRDPMDADRADDIDQPYLLGFQTATSWGRDRQPSKPLTEQRLRLLLEGFDDPRCMASAARGASKALREYGWAVELDLVTTSGTPLTPPTGEVAAALRRFRDPRITSCGALWALHLSLKEVRGLSVGAVTDGEKVVLADSTIPIPRKLAPFIRAQRLARRAQGATKEDLLLVGERGQLAARSVMALILAGLEGAVSGLNAEALAERPSRDGRWLADRGVGVEWIPRTERPRRVPGRDPHASFLARLKHAMAHVSWQRTECLCHAAHPPPTREMPAWPPQRAPHTVPRDHPWAFPRRHPNEI